MARGSFGRVRGLLDFQGSFEDVTWAATSVDLGEGWFLVSVNEGTIQQVVDEPNGVVQFLTDTGDNDSAVLLSGKFRPIDGQLNTEARYKVADAVTVATYHGFTETMALDTPVMPAEFDTVTMTYNGSGGMIGVQYDTDATTDDLRSLMGDGGAATAGSANGTRLNRGTVTADEWILSGVTLGPSGSGSVRAALATNELRDIDNYSEGVTDTDLFYAVCMLENRTAAAYEFEVDYVYCDAGRDWTHS